MKIKLNSVIVDDQDEALHGGGVDEDERRRLVSLLGECADSLGGARVR